jgi:hypothetical protein
VGKKKKEKIHSYLHVRLPLVGGEDVGVTMCKRICELKKMVHIDWMDEM